MSDSEPTPPATKNNTPPLPTATRTDERLTMNHWWQKARQIDVPQPETHFLNLEPPEDGGFPEYDIEKAINTVEKLGGEAFIKGGFRAADYPQGNHIQSPNEEVIKETTAELFASMTMKQTPIGHGIYLREYLPLTWDNFSEHDYHPEVRFFIRDGEIVCFHLRTNLPDNPKHSEKEIREYFDPCESNYSRLTDTVHDYAETVASEFNDGWWSADFVLTTNYNWYLTDMAIDALQYIEKQETWSNLSGHPGDCKHDLEHIHKRLSNKK